jgi:hypothetical protein
MPGLYWQPLDSTELNCNVAACSWQCSTAGVSIDPIMVTTTGLVFPNVAPGTPGGFALVGSVPLSYLDVAVSSRMAAGAVSIDLTASVPATGNTPNSLADCLNAGRAQGFGAWKLAGTVLNLFAPDGTTVVRSFNLDSATAPTQRT